MSKKAVIIAIGSYCGIFLLLFIFQSALVFPKGGRPFGDCEEWDAIEGTYQSVSYEEENIKFLQKGANTNLPSLLIFHGNSTQHHSTTFAK